MFVTVSTFFFSFCLQLSHSGFRWSFITFLTLMTRPVSSGCEALSWPWNIKLMCPKVLMVDTVWRELPVKMWWPSLPMYTTPHHSPGPPVQYNTRLTTRSSQWDIAGPHLHTQMADIELENNNNEEKGKEVTTKQSFLSKLMAKSSMLRDLGTASKRKTWMKIYIWGDEGIKLFLQKMKISHSVLKASIRWRQVARCHPLLPLLPAGHSAGSEELCPAPPDDEGNSIHWTGKIQHCLLPFLYEGKYLRYVTIFILYSYIFILYSSQLIKVIIGFDGQNSFS